MDEVYRPAFLAMDIALRTQGEILAACGFGPSERPFQVTTSGIRWRLRDYGGGARASILVVPSPINRPYIWDLAPDISAIGYCLDQDFHVHMVEWTVPRLGDGASGVDDYLDALAGAVAAVATASGGALPVLLGHSLGGALAAIFAACETNAASGIVLLSSPLCFGPAAGRFSVEVARLAGETPCANQLVPGAFIGQLMVRASALVGPRAIGSASFADALALANLLRIARWALDEIALPGKAVGQVIAWLYREDRFRRGLLPARGRTTGPSDLTLPVLGVINSADDIAPRGAVEPFLKASPSFWTVIEYPGEASAILQHVALLVGRQARRDLWPRIVDWMDRVATGSSPNATPS